MVFRHILFYQPLPNYLQMGAVGNGMDGYAGFSLHQIQCSFLRTFQKRIIRGASQAVLMRQPAIGHFNYDHTKQQAA